MEERLESGWWQVREEWLRDNESAALMRNIDARRAWGKYLYVSDFSWKLKMWLWYQMERDLSLSNHTWLPLKRTWHPACQTHRCCRRRCLWARNPWPWGWWCGSSRSEAPPAWGKRRHPGTSACYPSHPAGSRASGGQAHLAPRWRSYSTWQRVQGGGKGLAPFASGWTAHAVVFLVRQGGNMPWVMADILCRFLSSVVDSSCWCIKSVSFYPTNDILLFKNINNNGIIINYHFNPPPCQICQ